MGKVTLKELRSNPLHTDCLLLHGNGKLLDYDNPGTGEKVRYAQFNTRAIKDCPFRSEGCERVCYATKGNHVFPSCIDSRQRSYEFTRSVGFVPSMIYTIGVEHDTKRYVDAEMRIRLHESGDFYSLHYLKDWVRIWEGVEPLDNVKTTLYTKSFQYFLHLTEEEANTINRLLTSGKLTINWSLDDTTSKAQQIAYLECVKRYPKANTYRCTEHPEAEAHDTICDCADCGKCGTCNHATGANTVVKIHSASNADLEAYRKASK